VYTDACEEYERGDMLAMETVMIPGVSAGRYAIPAGESLTLTLIGQPGMELYGSDPLPLCRKVIKKIFSAYQTVGFIKPRSSMLLLAILLYYYVLLCIF